MKESGRATPGRAAPQCGDDKTRVGGDNESRTGGDDESRSGERHTQPHTQRHTQGHRGWYSRGYLPHFDSPHVIQHITYRLADSLPRAVLERMRAEVEASVRGDEKRKAGLRQRIETYLDAGHGSCVLQAPEVAACIVDTWFRFDGERYRLLEWVVMPNHCHVLIEPFEGAPLGKIVLSWKNYTARFINGYHRRTGVRQPQVDDVRRRESGRAAPQCGSLEARPPQCGDDEGFVGGNDRGRMGARESQVWQREYWDRFIRDERHLQAAKSYIVMNPVHAGLVTRPDDWPWSSAHY